jgi:hypothetical protein
LLTTELHTRYDLDPAAVDHLNQQGFVKLKGVLPPDVIQAYEPEITRNVIDLNTLHLPMEERSTYEKAFLQVQNLWQYSAVVREFVFSRSLARIAAELLGVDGVRMYHDQALYKEGGGGITPWHADQYYWPLSTDRVCTAWIPLQDTPMEMGPLAFGAGSHRLSIGRDLEISDESEATLQEVLESQRFPLIQEPFELGEVSYHLGWTFHRAEPNTTGTPRRVMTIIYMDADIQVAEPVNHHQRIDLGKWMPDARIGDIPDTELNPVLYRIGAR